MITQTLLGQLKPTEQIVLLQGYNSLSVNQKKIPSPQPFIENHLFSLNVEHVFSPRFFFADFGKINDVTWGK